MYASEAREKTFFVTLGFGKYGSQTLEITGEVTGEYDCDYEGYTRWESGFEPTEVYCDWAIFESAYAGASELEVAVMERIIEECAELAWHGEYDEEDGTDLVIDCWDDFQEDLQKKLKTEGHYELA